MSLSIGGTIVSKNQPFFNRLTSASKEQQRDVNAQRDTIFISNEAKKQFGQQSSSIVEQLMKQRDNIQEMRSNLVERTLENGDDISTIKEKLAEFDEQLAEIDQQLFAIEEQKRQKEQREKEEKLAASSNAATTEEAQLTSILQTTQTLQQAEALGRVKGILERTHRRLQTEMKDDVGRGVFLEAKKEKIQDLEKRMRSMDRSIHEQIGKAYESTTKNAAERNEEDEEEA